jgi:hypothetical protein
MLSLKTQNRVDLLFCHFVRKDSSLLTRSSELTDLIFEMVQPDSGSLYLKDVAARISQLIVKASDSDHPAPKNKGGRPPKWLLPTRAIRVPAEYAEALKEIALEWQSSTVPF